MIDDLGGRLGSFDRLEKGCRGDSSGWDRVLGGGAWFGATACRVRSRPELRRIAGQIPRS